MTARSAEGGRREGKAERGSEGQVGGRRNVEAEVKSGAAAWVAVEEREVGGGVGGSSRRKEGEKEILRRR